MLLAGAACPTFSTELDSSSAKTDLKIMSTRLKIQCLPGGDLSSSNGSRFPRCSIRADSFKSDPST